MKLASLLNEELIEITETISSKAGALEFLIEKIHKNYKHSTTKEAIKKAVSERELLGNTLVENGIAIPHARLENFEDLIVAVLILKKPIVEDNREIKMIFLILTSKASSQIYLNTLAAVARVSKEEPLYNKVYNSKNASEFISAILDADIRVKKELTVSDIMTTEVISASPDMTLKELVDIFSRHNLSYVPVINGNNNFIGEININDIIRLGIPNYATMVGNLSFLSSFEPFEEMLKNEDTIYVRDIMKKPNIEISPDASIIELAFKLSSSHKRHAAIVAEGNLIGIVSLVDLLNKVLRA